MLALCYSRLHIVTHVCILYSLDRTALWPLAVG